jgi:hypothetical protein
VKPRSSTQPESTDAATQIPVDAQGRVKAGTFATGVRLVNEPVHTAFTTSLYKNIYKNIRGFLARFRDSWTPRTPHCDPFQVIARNRVPPPISRPRASQALAT